MAIPNIDGLSLALPAFARGVEGEAGFFVSRPKLLRELKRHYLREVKRQVLKLLMASDAVTGKVRDKLGIERGAAKGLVGKGLMLGRGLVGAAVK